MLILTIVISVVLLVRIFLVGSFRITGSSLGETLSVGDFVLVNKVISKKDQQLNRLLLYKSPLSRDDTKPPLFVGRCIGMPGERIQMGIDGFRVNGRLLPDSHKMPPAFLIHKDIKASLLQTLESLHIPKRQLKEDSTGIVLRMSLREKELLVNSLSEVILIEMIEEYTMDYEFVMPGKGKTIELNEFTLMVYKDAILNETGGNVDIRNGKLFVQGVEETRFTFKNDYFWILSENETEGIDSRHLGLIPQSYIVGTVWFCWYSNERANRFKKIK